jgi:YD repeat-containing protein
VASPKNCATCNPGGASFGGGVNAGVGLTGNSDSVYTGSVGPLPLTLGLDYTTQLPSDTLSKWAGIFGTNRVSALDRSLQILDDPNNNYAVIAVEAKRPSGNLWEYRVSGLAVTQDADINDALTIQTSGTTITGFQIRSEKNDELETYNASGQLVSLANRAGYSWSITYSTTSTPKTIAPGAGYPITVTDQLGRSLQLTFDAYGHVLTTKDLAGQTYAFQYDGASGGCATYSSSNPACAAGNLTQITYPDGKTKVLYYNEAAQVNGGQACTGTTPVGNGFSFLLNHLTGIVDELGNRYATTSYDCNGRAVSTQHAGGADLYTLAYTVGSNGAVTSTAVTDPLTTSRTYNFNPVLAVAKLTGVTGQPGPQYSAQSQTFDVNGNVASRLDWNGNLTCYAHDMTRNLETVRVEGLPSTANCTQVLANLPTSGSVRVITTQWDASWRLPSKVAEPLKITTFTYNGESGASCGSNSSGLVPGVLCTKSEQATTDPTGALQFTATPTGSPRTWSYTYNPHGLVLTADGPRTDVSDVTTYTYYSDTDSNLGRRGNINTITNAAGQTTTVSSYDAHGNPLSITDANGLTTTLTYDLRQRLTSRAVGTETTSYTYDAAGNLTKVTLPDNSYLSYTYDAAHRLTAVADSAGDLITYTLDAMGNRTAENVKDPNNNLVQTHSRVFDALNRLQQDIGGQ